MSGVNINPVLFSVLPLQENSQNSNSNWRKDANAAKIRSIKDDLNFTDERFFPKYGPSSTRSNELESLKPVSVSVSMKHSRKASFFLASEPSKLKWGQKKMIDHKIKFNDLFNKIRKHGESVSRQQTPKMLEGSRMMENFRQNKFKDTMEFVIELKDMDANGIEKFSKYFFQNDDEAYKVLSNTQKEYREGMFDPSRDVAIQEKQAAIKKNVGLKKKWMDVIKKFKNIKSDQ